MDHIFEITDKTGRKIRLTKKQWTHITSPTSPHAYMTNYLEEIKETLINPDKMVNSLSDDQKVNYYKYYKKRERYLKNIVNYLNGDGFVITAHYVAYIK